MARKQVTGNQGNKFFFAVVIVIFLTGFLVITINAADPEGPDRLDVVSNTTKGTVEREMINVSGGRVAIINLSATVQNDNWKGFAGNVSGKYTLDDSSNSTIFDWTMTTITGRVYATRQSGTITWASINCSNTTHLESENLAMNHSSIDDNITTTFNATNNATSNVTLSG